jgi:hypothetical protein
MDAETKRKLKKLGKAEVERRSAELRADLAEANPAPIGSDEWGERYKRGTERERWLRKKLPLLRKKRLEALFVVRREGPPGSIAGPGEYVLCTTCGSAAPTALPRKLFYWASCGCGNIRWRCLLGWRKGEIRNLQAVVPVRLIGRG